MSISYPLTGIHNLPGFVEFSWEPDSNVAIQENPFTFQQKIYAWDGQRRKATVRVRELDTDPTIAVQEAIEWQTFILKLNGREGTFLMQDPLTYQHRGNYNLSDVWIGKVKGADQSGASLDTDGWEPGMADVLKKGDWISIANRLHQVLDDVDSDTAGEATLTIWPHARYDLTDNAEIGVGEQAWGTFRLLEFPRFAYNLDKYMTGFSFGCVEAF